MKNIDWGNAPEDATHYGHRDDENDWLACWHKKIGNAWYGYLAEDDTQWDLTVFENNIQGNKRIASFIERPAPWSGDGLPPVGIKCEVASDNLEQWYECLILAHHDGKAVMFCWGWTCDYKDRDIDYDAFPAERFRPIRTPEQIAAEERRKSIDEIYQKMISGQMCHLTLIEIATEIYEAGFRKGESK